MGISIYATWDGQTEDEPQQELDESYHQGPDNLYATRVLVPEAFDLSLYLTDENDDDLPTNGAIIPAATLAERLPATLRTVKDRYRTVYNQRLADDAPILKSYVEFVDFVSQLEAKGKNPRINASW